jgi:hypothetical protein
MGEKPSWDDAPEWAQWLTQGRYGGWIWWELKPKVTDWAGCDMNYWVSLFTGRTEGAGESPPSQDWRDTLEQRPEPLEGKSDDVQLHAYDVYLTTGEIVTIRAENDWRDEEKWVFLVGGEVIAAFFVAHLVGVRRLR